MPKYYISKGIFKKGPYTKEQLKAIKLHADTLVWVDGHLEWVNASQIEDLNDIILPNPPSRIKSFTVSPKKFQYKTLIFALILTLPFYLTKSEEGIRAYVFKLENKEAINAYELDRSSVDTTLDSNRPFEEQQKRHNQLARKVIDNFNQKDFVLNSYAKFDIFPMEDKIEIMDTINNAISKYLLEESLMYSMFIFVALFLIQLIPLTDIANYLKQFKTLFK